MCHAAMGSHGVTSRSSIMAFSRVLPPAEGCFLPRGSELSIFHLFLPLESLCMHRRDATWGMTLLPVRRCRECTAALVSGTLLPCLGLLGKTHCFIPLQLLPGRFLATGRDTHGLGSRARAVG